MPILLPSNSFIDGYIKTDKSLRIECWVDGSIMTTGKILVSKDGHIKGKVVCAELTCDGQIDGSVYCTGKVHLNSGARVDGEVFTKLIENESNDGMNCTIQIPNKETIDEVISIFGDFTFEKTLKDDELLEKVYNLFHRKVKPSKRVEKSPFDTEEEVAA